MTVKPLVQRLAHAWQLPLLLFGTAMLIAGWYVLYQGAKPEDVLAKDVFANVNKALEEIEPADYNQAEKALRVFQKVQAPTAEEETQYYAYRMKIWDELQKQKDTMVGFPDGMKYPARWRKAAKNTSTGKEARDNYNKVLRAYEKLNRLDESKITEEDRYRVAVLHMMLGNRNQAEKMMDVLQNKKHRQKIQKLLIDDLIANLDPENENEAIDSINKLEAYYKTEDSVNDRLWAVAKQAWIYYGLKQFDNLKRHLMLRLPLNQGQPGVDKKILAELNMLLGLAYLNLNDNERAYRQMIFARQLSKNLPENVDAYITLALGDIAFMEDRIINEDGAIEHYNKIITAYANKDDLVDVYVLGLKGYAQSRSRTNEDFTTSYTSFNQAIDTVRKRYVKNDTERKLRDAIVEMRRAKSEKKSEHALELLKLEAELAKAIAGVDRGADNLEYLPLTSVKDMAELYVKLGDKTFDEKMQQLVQNGKPRRLANKESWQAWNWLGSVDVGNIRKYYNEAAKGWEFYLANSPTQQADYGDALWGAAVNYGYANQRNKQIDLLNDYINMHRSKERIPVAMKMLGEAHYALGVVEHERKDYEKAKGHYKDAEKVFGELTRKFPKNLAAQQSYIPYSKSLRYLDRYREAEKVLEKVIRDNEFIRPRSEIFRNVQAELGELHYGRMQGNDYQKANGYLRQAIDLYAKTEKENRLLRARTVLQQDPGNRKLQNDLQLAMRQTEVDAAMTSYLEDSHFPLPRLAYRLANTHEAWADVLKEEIRQGKVLTPQAIEAKEQTIHQHLKDADEYYQLTWRVYEAVKTKGIGLTKTEAVRLKNTYFKLADISYDIGNWPQARDRLTDIVRTYPKDRDTLTARVKLINTYLRTNEIKKARVENANLKRIVNKMERDQLLETGEFPQLWFDLQNDDRLSEAS